MPRRRTAGQRLGRGFYARDVLEVAADTIGKLLVHETDEGRVVGRVVEAEAYRGPEDRAAHSYGNRRTARTEVMFGPPGHAYVFLVYGQHHQFNLVTGQSGQPQAVLIRALEPLEGMELISTRRGMPVDRVELTNGPGKLCQALAISLEHYGRNLLGGSLHLLDAPPVRVARSARVGIDYAGAWARKPWRFFEPGNRFVSQTPRSRRDSADRVGSKP